MGRSRYYLGNVFGWFFNGGGFAPDVSFDNDKGLFDEERTKGIKYIIKVKYNSVNAILKKTKSDRRVRDVTITFGDFKRRIVDYTDEVNIRGENFPNGLDRNYHIDKKYKIKYAAGGRRGTGHQTWHNIRWTFKSGRGTGRGFFNPNLSGKTRINILRIQAPVYSDLWFKYRLKIKWK